jgi:hypothetical protein
MCVSLCTCLKICRRTVSTCLTKIQCLPLIIIALLLQVKPPIDVNCAADTGNTPLHAAANNGNVNLVTILLQNPRIDINSKNPQCEEATPLHLAIMLGTYTYYSTGHGPPSGHHARYIHILLYRPRPSIWPSC